MNKTMRELIEEKHWSVQGLAKTLGVIKREVRWEKSNKPYKKSKKKIVSLESDHTTQFRICTRKIT